MGIRKGSLVKLDPNVVTERLPHLAHLANQNTQWKVEGVTGGKGRYRVNVGGGTTLPLDALLAVPQRKGKAAQVHAATR